MEGYLNNYVALNRSFRKRFIFRLGYDSGFFSEYNNMVLSILYCLKNGLEFNLSSTNSNISAKGWSDFFTPFCRETDSFFFERFNFRGHHLQSEKEKFVTMLYKLLTGNMLTQDLWGYFHSRDFEHGTFNIPELAINGSLSDATQRIIEVTWRFKPEVGSAIAFELKKLNLISEDFVGLHIRRGDKVSEVKNIDYCNYIETIRKHTSLKNVFLATDDYDVYLHLKSTYSDFNFFTFSKPFKKGFTYETYKNYNNTEKRKHLIELFQDIEMLSLAKLFVGTFSSNIGMYMGMRKGGKNVVGVDYPQWMIW